MDLIRSGILGTCLIATILPGEQIVAMLAGCEEPWDPVTNVTEQDFSQQQTRFFLLTSFQQKP